MITTVRVRNGTAVQWTAANPILGLGEMGYESDTNKLKFGNGVTPWASLPYFAGGGGSSTPSPGTGTTVIIDGGSPQSGISFVPDNTTYDGGVPSLVDPIVVLDGGSYASNGADTTPFDGGTYLATDGVLVDAGTPSAPGDLQLLDGGTP